MRFSVEPWAPEYGTPSDPEPAETSAEADADVEVPRAEWAPILPDARPASTVLFVDGVRRVDANVWIELPGGGVQLGLCAVYAAGAVRCDGSAEILDCRVERGLFTSAGGADDVVTRHGVYRVQPTEGSSPEELWLGIQQRMGALEGELARGHEADLMLLDGPLSYRRHVAGAVGYVKTQHVHYLPEDLRWILPGLPAGGRTPLFLTTSSWSRFSWYVRLAPAETPVGGIVRCEVNADGSAAEAARLADRVTVTLPRFASQPHKDPRAPQNLYPIGGLERALRRRLGDPTLMYRALRVASTGGEPAASR